MNPGMSPISCVYYYSELLFRLLSSISKEESNGKMHTDFLEGLRGIINTLGNSLLIYAWLHCGTYIPQL